MTEWRVPGLLKHTITKSAPVGANQYHKYMKIPYQKIPYQKNTIPKNNIPKKELPLELTNSICKYMKIFELIRKSVGFGRVFSSTLWSRIRSG